MQILGIMDNSQYVPGAVTAVVTTYEPDLQTLEAQFVRLAGQIDALLVIDNGSANAAKVAQLVSQFSFAQFCGVGENRGLGWAHNEGLRRALAEGADAVLLLDQDSLPSENMVVALRQALYGRVEDVESPYDLQAHFHPAPEPLLETIAPLSAALAGLATPLHKLAARLRAILDNRAERQEGARARRRTRRVA